MLPRVTASASRRHRGTPESLPAVLKLLQSGEAHPASSCVADAFKLACVDLAPTVSNSASNSSNRPSLRCSRFLKPFAHDHAVGA